MTKATENDCWILRECGFLKKPSFDPRTAIYFGWIDGHEYAWPKHIVQRMLYGQDVELDSDEYLVGSAAEAARRGVML